MAKIYTKGTTVVDEVLSGAARYDILEDGGGAFKADMQINLATSVAVAGTEIDAARLNNIETGIDNLDTKLADALDLLTTGGTSTAYTITTIGAVALVTGETFRVKFHATAGATPTLNRDAKGAKSLKYYDAAGAKQAATSSQIIANMILTIIYDGTDYVILGSGSGGNSIIYNNSTVTTSNLTGTENNVYNLTIAGLTANRNFVLPAPSAAGKEITINLLDGDDTYYILLIGDTGVTINGGSTATEYKRFRAKGESITFRSTSTSNWQVVEEIAQWDTFTAQVYQNGNVTSSPNYCQSLRVGNLVTMRGALVVTGAGSSGQKILVQNLPHSIANHTTTGVFIIGNGAVLDSGTAIYAVAVCAHDATTISFFDSGAGDFLGASPAWALANNDTISFTITYKVP